MESSIRELDGRTGHPIHRTGRTSGVREVPGDEGGERPVEVELLAGPRVAVHPFHRAHLLRRRSPRVTAHAPVDNSDAAEARPEPQFDPSATGSDRLLPDTLKHQATGSLRLEAVLVRLVVFVIPGEALEIDIWQNEPRRPAPAARRPEPVVAREIKRARVWIEPQRGKLPLQPLV